jgi:hypothetical protein
MIIDWQFIKYYLYFCLNTVLCVYKDILYKENTAKIWLKPTLFDFGPSFLKDNIEEISKRYIFLKISIIRVFFVKIEDNMAKSQLLIDENHSKISRFIRQKK